MIVCGTRLFGTIFLQEQIRRLIAAGFVVAVVCPEGHKRDTSDCIPGCTYFHVALRRSASPLADMSGVRSICKLLRQWKPDVVHAHTPKASLLACLAARICGCPIRLHTVHGLRSTTLRGPKRVLVSAMERFTCSLSTQCFAVSNSLRNEVLAKNYASAEKISVIGNGSCAGIDTRYFEVSRHQGKADTFRESYNIPKTAIVITCIGRLAKDKGVDTLHRAWEGLCGLYPEAHLLIAGPVDTEDPISKATRKRLAEDTRVTYLEGFLADPPTLLAASNIFVQPSLREGLGMAALEASSMELPVVASNITGLVDAVDDGLTGMLFPAGDDAELALKLSELIESETMREHMGRCGRRLVQSRYDREYVMDQTLRMYRDLSHQPRKRLPTGKRLIDIAGAAILLILTSPLLLAAAVAIAVSMGRPVTFRQRRGGLNGTVFTIAKLRTMRLARFAGESDQQRLTAVGALLRKFSLDELPQLWNVLHGDMSLIGPRPLLADYLPRYNAEEARRHEVRPGITGLAQISGRNELSWAEKFALDRQYVDEWSYLLDIRILCRTLLRILMPRGIGTKSGGSMSEFMGSLNAPKLR